jgi:tetratricopeptide (TPR) repeat protein
MDRAVAAYRAEKLHEACPAFEALAARRPSDPEPHLYLLGCAIRHRNVQRMDAEQTALRRLAPGPAAAHGLAAGWLASAGQCRAAEDEYALAPKPAGAVEFALAQCYQAVGDVEAAITRYRKAIESNPQKEEHYLSFAFLLIGMGRSEDAGKLLIDALQQFPRSVRVLATMSLLHLELGYPDRARIGYERARALDPGSAMVWKLLGRIQNAEGSYEDAVRSFRRSAAIDPRDAQTFLFIGMAHARLEGGADQALAAFLRALELDPGLLEARFQAASIYLQAKEEYAKAVSHLERVVAAAPGFARAHQLLIQAYQRLGWTEKAAAEARKFRALTSRQDRSLPNAIP